MALRLNGSNTGYVELDVPADAGSHTLILPDGGGTAHQVLKNSATAGTLEYGVTLPSGNGSAHQVLKNSATAGTLEYGLALPSGNGTSGQYLQSDGTGGSSWATPAGALTWLTESSLVSQTSVLVTGISTTAQYIIIALTSVNAGNATEGIRVRFGNGSLETGVVYAYGVSDSVNQTYSNNDDKYLARWSTSTAEIYDGHIVLTRMSSSSWAISQTLGKRNQVGGGTYGGGLYVGTDFIDRVQIANGSTTYSSGAVRVGYIQ